MTPEERAAVVYDLVRAGFVASSDDVTVTASEASVAGAAVTMTLAATRSGEPVELDNPHVFVNPPLGVRDGDDVIVDPEAAIAEMLLRSVPQP